MPIRWVVTLAGSAVGGFVAGALVLTGVDLYLSGYGTTPLGARRLLEADAVGVHLSAADGLAFAVALAAAVMAAFALRMRKAR
jgi:hypothetical protein